MNHTDLPSRIRHYLSRCAGAVSGQGGHNKTFSVACLLVHGFALSESDALGFISEWNSKCSPPWTERELLHKIRGAIASPEMKPHGYMLVNGERLSAPRFTPVKTPPRWPPLDEPLIKRIQQSHGGLSELWERSPIAPSDVPDPERVLDNLFPADSLLCLGQSSSIFQTKPRSEWRGQSHRNQFIVPSPMSAPTGLTKDGKPSAHCLDNTGPRRFLVVEFDQSTVDFQASALMFLSRFMPLACAVHSGSKSVHGWFFSQPYGEERAWKFFRYAVSLGADRATWTRSQFVRLPDGTRDTGAIQNVYYLNPAALRGGA
jgi:hypothetical protein